MYRYKYKRLKINSANGHQLIRIFICNVPQLQSIFISIHVSVVS